MKSMAKRLEKWQLDDLPSKMYTVRDMLEAQPSDGDLPTVIYWHCEAGTDRTGEVSGCYMMSFLNVTYPQALAVQNHIQTRDMAKASKHGMEWCCEWLAYGTAARQGLDCPS